MRLATLMAATVIGTSTLAMAAGPTTRPATTDLAAPAEAATAPTSVLVLPFEQIGGTAGNYGWIGRAVQQNLVTELGRSNKMLEPLAPASAAATPASDVKAAIDAGKSANADAVVFGSFQILDQDLRFNGQVVNVSTGETVGTLKSTGTVRDLFAMEDTVATQAKRLLAPPPPEPIYQPANLPLAIPAQPQPQQAAATPVQQPAVSYANDYNRYVYYPNYGYGYGYAYGYPGYYGYYPGYWNYPAAFSVYVPNTGAMVGHVTQPVEIGTSRTMVAKGMITVPGNFLPNGQLASK